MAKLRKTRAQKVATAEKRSQFMYSYVPAVENYEHTAAKKISHPLPHTGLAYVKHDLWKTIFISLFLITAQIILLLLLQHHVVKIPGATY